MPNQSPYAQEFIDGQKAKLEASLVDLQNKSDVRNEAFESQDSNPEEAAGDVAMQFNDQAESAVLNKKISQIKFALSQIADGSYGRCQNCGSWISQERLEYVPTATKCANC